MTQPVERFTILPALPAGLEPLSRIARNLHWTWDSELADVLAEADRDGFARAGGNPIAMLASISPRRLAELAQDPRYVKRLATAERRLNEHLGAPSWYETLTGAPRTIAYFSPEFGVGEALPQYSGGLGILAGDHLKAASDLGVPIVGVGLFYRQGYFRQVLTSTGAQREEFPELDPTLLPMARATGSDGAPVEIAVALPGAVLHAAVWRVEVGRVSLLLLDANVPANAPAERGVTDRLYGGESEHRLRQEILLGIGGVKALAACGIEPDVFHTNEGHAGFLGVERIRRLVEEGGLAAEAALEAVRAGTVFTTHTPVPAGIDRFPLDLVSRYFGDGGVASGLPLDRLLGLGAEAGGDTGVFNMAAMGLRLAARVNGVSRLHGRVSRGMFGGLWPGLDTDQVPIGHVTNGVHAETWVGAEFDALYRSRLGDGYGTQSYGFETLREVSDEELGGARARARERLVAEVRRRIALQWGARGLRGHQLDWIDGVLDPHALTIGFARRVPTYKRLTLILRQRKRFLKLIGDAKSPLQLVVAGKAHPNDHDGKRLIEELGALAARRDLRHRLVMLPDYDMELARVLVAGVDVWLNNPLRPFEACGTSGMKAALNGALNLSILDGWWDELYDGTNGWAIPSADDERLSPAERDDVESAAILDLIEHELLPRFYRPPDGASAWLGMVRDTISTLGPKILASRMVRDYVNDYYVPAAQDARRLAADGHVAAERLAAWKARVRAGWPEVSVAAVTAEADGRVAGDVLPISAAVRLGDLGPDDVVVQALYGPPTEAGQIEQPAVGELGPQQQRDGAWLFGGEVILPPGPLGVAVRVLPRSADLGDPRELGLVASSSA